MTGQSEQATRTRYGRSYGYRGGYGRGRGVGYHMEMGQHMGMPPPKGPEAPTASGMGQVAGAFPYGAWLAGGPAYAGPMPTMPPLSAARYLQATWFAPPYAGPRPRWAPTRMSDSDIKAQIEGTFARTAGLAGSNIKIEVQQGVVTLSGEVPSSLAKRQAEAMVYPIPAVRDIKDNLTVAGARS